MEEIFVPDEIFKIRIHDLEANLEAVDGHMRWVVTREDRTKYALRPESAKL